tara:strand:- start:1264 stop:1827 length:564 start_codon:yes stop_codon:yes gene_type:complete
MKKILFLLVIPTLSVYLNAHQDIEIKKCLDISEPEKRLWCFDTLFQNIPRDEPEKPTKTLELEIIKNIEKEDVSDSGQAIKPQKEAEEIIEDQRKEITSLKRKIKNISNNNYNTATNNSSFDSVIVSVEYRQSKFRFELDNGQTWQLTDSGIRARLKKGQTIKIEPGGMRSFFLVNSKGRFRTKQIK